MFENIFDGSWVSVKGFLIWGGLWFEAKPGLNVVYGKNGVGKSTVINFIEAIAIQDELRQLTGRVVRSPAEGAKGRVVIKCFAPEMVSGADRIAREVRKTDPEGNGRQWEEIEYYSGHDVSKVSHYLTLDSLKIPKWTDERVYEGIARVLEESPEQIARNVESIENTLDENDGRLSVKLLHCLIKQILQEKLNPKSVRDITESLRKTVLFHYTEWSPESAEIASINERLSTYGVDGLVDLDEPVLSANNLKDLLFHDLYLLFVDVVICRLQYELNEKELDVESYFDFPFGSSIDSSDERTTTFSSVRNDADEIIGIVARAIYEQRLTPLMTYSRYDGPNGMGTLRLIFDLSGEDGIQENSAALENLRNAWNVMDVSGELSVKERVRYAWQCNTSVLSPEKFDLLAHSSFELLPFNELMFPMGYIAEAPFEVFRLDDSLDIDRVLSEVAAITIEKELFEALAILDEDEQTGNQLSEFVKPLNEVFEPVSKFIVSLGIGIDGMRAEVSPRIGEWVLGQGVKLVFVTTTSEASFDQLSSAQQFWVKAGMWLVAAQKADSGVLVIADEPDRSLHERAAYNVMEALASSGLDVIVSSHSVAALRTRNAVLHHLEVGPDGRRTLAEVALGEDVLVAAERFGTTPYDLLSLKRMMILVEGAHDAAVVNSLLGLSENKLLGDRVLVAPMRGVKNVVSAADSVLVTEFSELNILIVVDNGRNEVFKPILAELRERDTAGASEKELKQILTAHRVGSEASFEERMLFDLLERVIHRGILRRLDLFALSVGDVVELLPATGFSSSVGWEELRREYRLSGLRTDFKSWLRETHQISVSVRTVQKAFDNSDSVHPELVRLLQQIELGCMAGKEI